MFVIFFLCKSRLRPASLASDFSLEYDFVVDAIEWADRSGLIPEGESVFCRFHATSPFQSYEDMHASIDSLSANPTADSSVLLRPSPVNPEKTILINDDHQLFPVAIGFDGSCASVIPKIGSSFVTISYDQTLSLSGTEYLSDLLREYVSCYHP